MSETAERLKASLLELPEVDRLELANFLYDSLPPAPGVLDADDTGFDAVLQRRLDDLESGKVVGIPAEQVMKRLREKYAK
jgi:putative addiction module component (TIGR02574 family)